MKISTKYDFSQIKEIKLVRKTDKLEKYGVRIDRFGLSILEPVHPIVQL